MSEINIKAEAEILLNLIEKELINTFKKSESKAAAMIKESKICDEFSTDPLFLHCSAFRWATHILGKLGEYEALESIYNKNT